MKDQAPAYLALLKHNFNDHDVDNLIEHFRDKERRKTFFRDYKELEMLYEIISPDAFLRPYIDDYTTLSSIYEVVRKAYTKQVYVDRAFQKKTNELVQKHIGAMMEGAPQGFVKIDATTIDVIKKQAGGQATKVINFIKSIEKKAEDESEDPFLVALSDRAKVVQENFEDRQLGTAEALEALLSAIALNEKRKQEQAAQGLDNLTYFVLCKLTEDGIGNAKIVSENIAGAFKLHINWQRSERELRELRKKVTLAIYAHEDDLGKVTTTVDALFNLLERAFKQ